jgi:hypothetical protein
MIRLLMCRAGEDIQRGSDKGSEAVAKGVRNAKEAAEQTERNFERATSDRKVGLRLSVGKTRGPLPHADLLIAILKRGSLYLCLLLLTVEYRDRMSDWDMPFCRSSHKSCLLVPVIERTLGDDSLFSSYRQGQSFHTVVGAAGFALDSPSMDWVLIRASMCASTAQEY